MKRAVGGFALMLLGLALLPAIPRLADHVPDGGSYSADLFVVFYAGFFGLSFCAIMWMIVGGFGLMISAWHREM